MNLTQIAHGHGFQFTEVSEDAIQLLLTPLVKTDVQGGWIARCGISRVNPNIDSWCVVFEVATYSIPQGATNIWLTEPVNYLNYLARYCTDQYGFMEIPTHGGTVTSRLTWSVDTIRQFEITHPVPIAVLSGSVVYNIPAEYVVAGVIPLVINLIDQINQVVL